VPKLGVFSGEEICRILESEGFRRVRQRGSHAILQKEVRETTITVPVPMHRVIRIGTLQSIIRQSGVARERFLV
jgi:predicted RNA binding protein YcfA (HicA-like mRNA interferase family)